MMHRVLTVAVSVGLFASLVLGMTAASGANVQKPKTGIPGARGIFAGCYLKKGGALRLVKTSSRCKRAERRVKWSTRGPAGPRGVAGSDGARGPQGAQGATGSAGATGAQGPAGTQGPPGVAGVTLVTARIPASDFDSTSPKVATATCGAGQKSLGGGIEIERGTLAESDLTKLVTTYSKPVSGLTGWTTSALEASTFGETWALTAYAICATVGP